MMMDNNFDNTIKNLQQFDLTPSAQVWEEIENSLNEKRKKRVAVWWWILPALGLFICSIVMVNRNIFTSSTTNQAIAVKSITPNVSNTSFDKDNISSIQNNKKIVVEELSQNKAKIVVVNKELITNKHRKNITAQGLNLVNPTVKSENSYALNNDVAISTEKDRSIASDYRSVINNSDAATLPNDTVKILNQQPATADTIKKVEAIANNKKLKSSASKLKYNFVFGSGLNYISRNNIVGQNNNDNIYTNAAVSSSVPSVPSGISYANLPLANTGFKISTGVDADYSLSKKWMLQAGLRYTYLENNILVAQMFSNMQFAVSNGIASTSNVSVKNRFHLLEIPVNIKYCFQLNSKNKLSLLSGASASFSLHNNWLFADDSKGVYTSENASINKALLALQAGISVNFNNKFSLDILAKKYVTPVQKTSAKYYWQQLDFQISIPILNK